MPEVREIDKLHLLEPALREAGVRALYMFGSIVRGAAQPSSDLDLLFEADPARGLSLLDQARLQSDLSSKLGRPVDLIERSSLRPSVRRRAEAEMVRIF